MGSSDVAGHRRWRTQAVGDAALLVEFGHEVDRASYRPETHCDLLALSDALVAAELSGVVEVQPALVNLLVRFDPVVTDHGAVAAAVEAAGATPAARRKEPGRHRIEVCYDEPFAPDLIAVADQTELTPAEVAAAHLAGTYEVLMYGFAPGYGYLGGVPDSLVLPRKPAAVRDVPAGSVIISGNQCLVTTIDMPTGWWVIGRSPTRLLLDDPNEPFRMSVGDQVEFSAVGPGALTDERRSL